MRSGSAGVVDVGRGHSRRCGGGLAAGTSLSQQRRCVAAKKKRESAFHSGKEGFASAGGGQDVGIKAEGGTPQDCFGIIGGVVSCQRCRPNSAEHGSVCAARRSRDLFRLYSKAWAKEFGSVRRKGSAKASGSSGYVVGGCLWDHHFVSVDIVAELQAAVESAGFTGTCRVGST